MTSFQQVFVFPYSSSCSYDEFHIVLKKEYSEIQEVSENLFRMIWGCFREDGRHFEHRI